MKVEKYSASILTGSLLFLLVSCATVSETGRSQLMLVSPAQEIELGFSEFENLKTTIPISQDEEINAMVNRVGQRIAAVAPLPNAEWEFVVFDQPDTPNAFALPGGKVGIFTGILTITENDEGLATVIGHEVAHVVARHGGERISEALLTQLGGQALDIALQTRATQTRNIVLGAYGLGTTVGFALPHSRKQELEADHLGLFYMARAGFDPRQAVAFWKRFGDYSRQQGGRPPEFLSTHPVDQRRISQLESILPEALEEYQAAGGR